MPRTNGGQERTITVDCSESIILPFGQKPENPSGLDVPHTEDLDAALEEANEAQVHDDDDLPSMDDILSQFSSSPAMSSPSVAKKGSTGNQKRLPKSDTEYSPDISLTIPGELVLAISDRFYYPGRVMTFNNKTNKYKVDYASGHSISIERKKFFTRYEKGFQTCPLGELALPTIIDNYEDEELESQVRNLYPALYAIVAGTHDESGRLRAFMQGGKAKRSLAQRVGPGSFNRAEYALISNLLQSEFLPGLVTTMKSKVGTYHLSASESLDPPMKRDGDITRDFSDQMRLHFVTDVLLPETITRLTMQRNRIAYTEAEQRVMEYTMEASARSLLLELMAKSKEGLSLAEKLCSQAREELHACQSHSDEIEKIYSKLCFVSRQIKVQIADLQRDLKSVSLRMDNALHALRSREVDPEIQKGYQGDDVLASHNPKATVLFDFVDEVSLQGLQKESGEKMQRIQATTDQLQGLVLYFESQRMEFKGYLTNAISLDESALSFAREKMHLQEHHTTTMAESLVSLANHYDQVTQVLEDDMQPMQEELEVLESDTAEVLVIIEELEESLILVQATSEEIGVREHLYITAYQEAVAIFKKVQSLEPELAQLVDIFRSAEGLEEDFDAAEKLIGEIDGLAIWYEEFHNSYGALTMEIVRRHQAHEAQQRLVRDFIDRAEASYADEMNRRAMFSERHEKFLPMDICPAFADPPVQYEVVSHGEWLLPMPTRATLQFAEGHIRD
ncbi:autophagy protein 17 [Dissophora ornata]|nr:autophagy protein 17 [Dissophora ornata]